MITGSAVFGNWTWLAELSTSALVRQADVVHPVGYVR
jgi:hypothetical protein